MMISRRGGLQIYVDDDGDDDGGADGHDDYPERLTADGHDDLYIMLCT